MGERHADLDTPRDLIVRWLGALILTSALSQVITSSEFRF